MPGKALKLEEAQKNVLSNSGTRMQLGSGWKPGSIGFMKVEFAGRLFPTTCDANDSSRPLIYVDHMIDEVS
jgi:hypothetical protein